MLKHIIIHIPTLSFRDGDISTASWTRKMVKNGEHFLYSIRLKWFGVHNKIYAVDMMNSIPLNKRKKFNLKYVNTISWKPVLLISIIILTLSNAFGLLRIDFVMYTVTQFSSAMTIFKSYNCWKLLKCK